jgi:hypothetical protein
MGLQEGIHDKLGWLKLVTTCRQETIRQFFGYNF